MAAARHILLTGGNSGIGFEAAVVLCRAGHRLTLPCRDRATAEAAGRRVLERAGTGLPPVPAVCNLADLESVRACAAAQRARGTAIDTLVLNAGLQYAGASEPRRTAQGHELSFGVNHLGHFLLAHQLWPLLAAGRSPRLVVTASEVHDPTTAGGKVGAPAGLGALAGLVPGQGTTLVDGSAPFSADKAYKDSKLCNVLFAREFARRLEARGTPAAVIAWSPGLVIPPTSTGGFWRYSRQSNELGQRLFALAARSLLRLTESVENAGALLAALAVDDAYAASGFTYFRNRVTAPGRHLFEATATSSEGQDPELARRLWEASAALVGVGADRP
ncbi:SDR family NAD(P)-dependent oxidoreductase [Cyanobium sp. N5-Cardenillas]|uniref:SDR family NAD(P)-dependent oxidoreductase n=1 Tax=Cyanobium sp. N5-Cardenillas TaxID=2823720 RepID=UPI0020CF6385|nr:SDR family NAD(P)-dependent oxidoreductase [Cyanobium sp. N5-Cardenillas]MCP9784794.1 SDR family NAD(P)-dependent oxidoreductase [Cyanobium sp. N5-Cardenillas]